MDTPLSMWLMEVAINLTCGSEKNDVFPYQQKDASN